MSNYRAVVEEYCDLAACLAASDFTFAVMKPGELSGLEHPGDLDLLVNDSEHSEVVGVLEERGYQLSISERCEPFKSMWRKYVFGAGFASIHIHRRIAWDGHVALNKDLVIRRRIFDTSFGFLVSPEDEVLVEIAHQAFEERRTEGRVTVKWDAELDMQYIMVQLEQVDWCREVAVHDTTIVVECNNNSKGLAGRIRAIWKKVAEIKERRGVIIGLVGPDGSGKSTLAHWLVDELETSRLRCFTYRYWGWRSGLIGRLRSRSHRSRQGGDELREGMSSLFQRRQRLGGLSLTLAAIDYILSGSALYLATYLGKSFIVDRCFVDVVLSDVRIRTTHPLVRMALKLVPLPTKLIVLKSPARVLFERKKEFPEKELEWLGTRYQDYAEAEGYELIDTSGEVAETGHEILKSLWLKNEKIKWV